jgi:hypothetical protein
MKPNQQDEVLEEDTSTKLEKDFEFTPHGCQFRQRGPYLVCISCEVQHATYLGMDRIMVGEDSDGKPIIKIRGEHS